jgi:hypothetical protein
MDEQRDRGYPQTDDGSIEQRELPDPGDQAGNIGDALGHDPSNLGDDVHGGADQTFPDVQPSDKTF